MVGHPLGSCDALSCTLVSRRGRRGRRGRRRGLRNSRSNGRVLSALSIQALAHMGPPLPICYRLGGGGGGKFFPCFCAVLRQLTRRTCDAWRLADASGREPSDTWIKQVQGMRRQGNSSKQIGAREEEQREAKTATKGERAKRVEEVDEGGGGEEEASKYGNMLSGHIQGSHEQHPPADCCGAGLVGRSGRRGPWVFGPLITHRHTCSVLQPCQTQKCACSSSVCPGLITFSMHIDMVVASDTR